MIQESKADIVQSTGEAVAGWEVYRSHTGLIGIRRTILGRLNTEAHRVHSLIGVSMFAGMILPISLCLLHVVPPDAFPFLLCVFFLFLPLLIVAGGFCWAFLSSEELYRQGNHVVWKRRFAGQLQETILIAPTTVRLHTRIVRKNSGERKRFGIQTDLFLEGRGRHIRLESFERPLDDAARAFPDRRPEDDPRLEQLAEKIAQVIDSPLTRT